MRNIIFDNRHYSQDLGQSKFVILLFPTYLNIYKNRFDLSKT